MEKQEQSYASYVIGDNAWAAECKKLMVAAGIDPTTGTTKNKAIDSSKIHEAEKKKLQECLKGNPKAAGAL